MYALILFTLSALTNTIALALPQGVHCAIPSLCYPNVDPSQDPSYKEWPKPKPKNDHKLIHDRAEPAPAMKVAGTTKKSMILAGVYICEDATWGGQCTHMRPRIGSGPEDCTMIENGKASSIGPDPGFYCIFYTNAFCESVLSDASDALGVGWPGIDNLGFTQKGDYNDRLLSYQCFLDDDNLNLDPETGLRIVKGNAE